MQDLRTLLHDSASRHAARPALSYRGATLTYAGLERAADRLARRLESSGVRPGQRVAIVTPNQPCLVIAFLAVWRIGAVAVPLNARWREFDLGRALADAEPSALLCVRGYLGYSFVGLLPGLLPSLPSVRRCIVLDAWGEVEEELPGEGREEAEPLDAATALILYTSGSTGTPKGALISGASEVNGALAMNEALGGDAEDRVVFVVPISHAFGLTCLLAALAAGARAVLVDSTTTLEPTLEAVAAERATVLHGSPGLFTGLLKAAPDRLRGLRTGFVAGAPPSGSMLEEFDRLGVRVLNLYGMTELGAVACVRPADPPAVRYATAGRALPGFRLRIADDGEVQAAGPFVTAGYFRRAEQSAAAFDGEWFRTGDLGALDADGNLTILGRAKDVVKVSGLNVLPAEVEGLLLTHPDVLEAAVVGVPHPLTGEALHAFVVARPGAHVVPATLLQFARARIAGYKLPYAIDMVAELAILPTGKIDRLALKRSLQETARAGS
jgi:acyl-CoA synthetase (AMP-forming)/AMP-acid ligase II